MLFAQADVTTWADILEHSPLVGFALFAVWGLSWLGRRAMGADGILIRIGESVMECNAKNSETIAKLEETARKQQELCNQHVLLATNVAESAAAMKQWHADPQQPVAAHKVRQGLIQACDSLGRVCHRQGIECSDEIAAVRAKLE